jgi:hypothetical protein
VHCRFKSIDPTNHSIPQIITFRAQAKFGFKLILGSALALFIMALAAPSWALLPQDELEHRIFARVMQMPVLSFTHLPQIFLGESHADKNRK